MSPSAAGATGRPPWGLRQGKSWSAGQALRSRAISSAVPVRVPSGARCHMTTSTAHVEKGHARGGVYTWMVYCGRARRTRDAWSTLWTMSAARTSTIPVGSTTIPAAGPPWRPRVCRATFVWPVWATRSTASWMFRLPRVVSSWIQPYATPQGGACSRVPQCGQCPVGGGGLGVLPGATALPGAVAPLPHGAEGLHAARRRCGPRGHAACGGFWDHLQDEVRVCVLWQGVPAAVLKSQPPC